MCLAFKSISGLAGPLPLTKIVPTTSIQAFVEQLVITNAQFQNECSIIALSPIQIAIIPQCSMIALCITD